MRVFPKLAFLTAMSVAALPLTAKAALARAVKTAHKAEAHGTAKSVAHDSRRAEASSRHKSALELRHHEVVVHKQALAVHEPRVVEHPRVERPHAVAARVVQPDTPAEDVVPSVDDSPVEVHHNRKIHLTEETAPPIEVSAASVGPPAEALTEPAPQAAPTQAAGAPAAPRQATLEDFMPSVAKPAEPAALVAVKPAAIAKAAPIVRKVAPKPVPLPIVVAEAAPPPPLMAALFSRTGRLIIPPALKGSHEILLRQNAMADRDGLERVQDDDDLDRMRGAKTLVALPAGSELLVDERLPMNRRYCRPWTAQFLTALARAHYARFHTALQVNSAVRTVEFQERLRYTNGNAAASDGEAASPHLTGQAVDLAKHGLSMTEIAWLRGYLLPLTQQGKIDVEEEFQQACFHISVYKKYLPQTAPKRVIQAHRSPAVALAAAIR